MKRPLILSLAIAFAFNGSAALALGLGPVHVKSRLNQPLDAEISIIQGSVDEAAGLIVQLASGEDFDRVGLDRSRISVPLEFTLVRNARGEPVIRVTSKEPIREPFLDFLVEANWPKGRLLREYTVLLDPPVMAPLRTPAPVVAKQAAPPATTTTTQPLASRPAPRPAPKPTPAAPVASTAKAAPAAAPAKPRVAADEYGPVASGETLWEIAQANRSDGAVSLNRMMLALLRANPDAFADGNINALKRGAILRMPSEDELAAVGARAAVAAEVSRQTEAWRNARGIAPTRVATSTPAPASAAARSSRASTVTAKPKDTERLTLVPPRAGKDSLAANGAPGSGTGAAGETRAELARTREALSSSNLESTELKSRVAELEEINAKSDRLIGLKNSEIADLQRQLEALRKDGAQGDSASATATTPESATPAAPPTPGASGEDQASAPAPATGERDIWGNPQGTSTDATTDAAGAVSDADGIQMDTGIDSEAVTTALDEPVAALSPPNPAITPPTTVVSPPGPPTTTTPTTDSGATAPIAVPPASPAREPWYAQSWVRIAALLGAVLLVLFGLLGLRRRKPAVAASRTSIASAFGDHPPVRQAAAVAESASTEEEILRQQLAEHPEDVGLHLELLSLYYADNDVAAFEVGAQEMATHVGEGDQLEWQQVRAMGAELAPHNPLFVDDIDVDDVDGNDYGDDYDVDATTVLSRDAAAPDDLRDAPLSTSTYDADATLRFRSLDLDAADGAGGAAESRDDGSAFDFDVPSPETPIDLPEIPPPDESAAVPSFDLDLDALDEADQRGTAEATTMNADDDEDEAMAGEFLGSEDAVGTKLDLARAYLDMGDPDGARAMLEEVLGEGNPDQQDEARRLIAEIR